MRKLIELALADINKLTGFNTPVLCYYNAKSGMICASPKIGSIIFLHNIRAILKRSTRSFTFILRPVDIINIKQTMLTYLNNSESTLWAPVSNGFVLWRSYEIFIDSYPVSFMSEFERVKIYKNKKLSWILRFIVPNIRKLYKYLKSSSL